MLVRIKDVLVPVTRTYDVDDATLDTLAGVNREISRRKFPWTFDQSDAVTVLLYGINNVVRPILGYGGLTIGGEQYGNMLCVEELLARTAKLDKLPA